MPTGLYLDSARLGLMPPRARRAHHEFVRLVAREGASAAVVDLLRGGFDGWPRGLRGRHPDLADWRGIGSFRQSVRSLAGAPDGSDVLLASHSRPLMQLAARLLCLRCRAILHTDLEWPPYLEILRSFAARHGRRLIEVPLRRLLFEDHVDAAELVGKVAGAFRREGAEGALLTAVTHDGIRLPVGPLAASLGDGGRQRFLVIDAAQALGHAPLRLGADPGDLYLGGCHKWVGSGLPLSVAVMPNPRTLHLVREVVGALSRRGSWDDPLSAFVGELSGDRRAIAGGTVNLAPLFTAAAAVSAQLARADPADDRLARRLENARLLALAAGDTGWRPLSPHPDHRSGILMLQGPPGRAGARDAGPVREAFRRRGVTLTAYDGGLVRASLPDDCWGDAVIREFASVLHGTLLDVDGVAGHRDYRSTPRPGARTRLPFEAGPRTPSPR